MFLIDDPDVGIGGESGEVILINGGPRSEDAIELDIRRKMVNLEMNACHGLKISVFMEELEVLRLEMKARIQADFEAELAAD